MSSNWDEEKVYDDGDRFFSDLCAAIDSAEERIELESYIFDQDAIGNRVLKHLKSAVARGVKVRLLLDGIGCSDWGYLDLNALVGAKIEARFYHPLPWQVSKLSPLSLLAPRVILVELWKLNRRNHRKTCVVDRKMAFLGGLNISARHSKKYAKQNAWRDTSIRIQGASMAHLSLAFEHAWLHHRSFRFSLKKFPALFSAHQTWIRLNISRKQRIALQKDLVARISHAKSRIWITNPYFIPNRALVRAFQNAAASGIDVKLLLSKNSDIWGIKWAIEAFYRRLLASGVKIYEYKSSILHAKTLIVDSWTTVGSSNLNHRSLFQDLEVDVVLKQKESIQVLENHFVRDLQLSEKIELQDWLARPWFKKVREKTMLLFRRWL